MFPCYLYVLFKQQAYGLRACSKNTLGGRGPHENTPRLGPGPQMKIMIFRLGRHILR